MSTFTGQSFLQPLHDKHRSSASRTSSDFHSSTSEPRRIISCRRRALPLVLCFSSWVTMKLGHIVPPSSRRHFPTPTQRVAAWAKLPWSLGYENATLTGREE